MRLNTQQRHDFYERHHDGLLNTATGLMLGALPVGLLVEVLTDSPKLGAAAMAGAVVVAATCMEGVMTTHTPEEQDAIFIDAFGEYPPDTQAGQTE